MLQRIEQEADTKASGPLPQVRMLLGRPRRAGDVEVRPRRVANELGEKRSRSAGPAVATAGVLDVGDVALDFVLVLLPERQRPEAFAGAFAGGAELLLKLLIVAEHAGREGTEGDDTGAGQRGKINDRLRVSFAGVRERIAENDAAFGVGIEHFDGDSAFVVAFVAGDDVAGPVTGGAGHVLGGGDDTDDVERKTKGRNGAHGAENSEAAALVEFHLVHLVSRFDGDAAGIESEGFADQRNRFTVLGSRFRVIRKGDEARVARAAGADGEQAAETGGFEGGLVENRAGEVTFFSERTRVVGKNFRIDKIGGQIPNGARVVGGLGDDSRAGEQSLGDSQVGVFRKTESERFERCVVVGRGLELEELVGSKDGRFHRGDKLIHAELHGGLGDADGAEAFHGGAGGPPDFFGSHPAPFAEAGQKKMTRAAVQEQQLFVRAVEFLAREPIQEVAERNRNSGSFFFVAKKNERGYSLAENSGADESEVHGVDYRCEQRNRQRPEVVIMATAFCMSLPDWKACLFTREWVIATLIAALVCAGAVVAASGFLRWRTGKNLFNFWTGGWAFFSFHLTTMLAAQKQNDEQVLPILALGTALASFALFLLGGLQMTNARREKWILYGGTAAVMAMACAGAFLWPQWQWMAAMGHLLLAMSGIHMGRIYWQRRERSSELLAAGLVSWGAFLLLLPVMTLWPITEMMAYASLAASTLAIAVGMVLMEEAEFSERGYREVLDATDSGVFVLDLQTLNVLYANRTAERMLKYSLAELTRMRMTELCPDLRDTRDNVLDHRAALGALFRPHQEALLARKDEAMILCEGNTHVIRWWNRTALQINLREVEPEKTIGQVLRRAEKMSSLGQLVAGVAHELNNPLAVVVAYAQLMAKQAQTDSKTKNILRKIVHESDRAAKIVRDMLSFARPCQPQLRVMNVNDLVAGVLEVREAECRAQRVQCEMQFAPELPPTKADPQQIEQVLNNLITNALHAMSEQTTDRRIRVSTETTGFHIRVIVADTGPGIPASVMDKIFDPFFSTKAAGKGTGLGLSISNTIMQEHRGKIWAQSEAGHGAKFFVELLIVPCEEEAKKDAVPQPLLTDETGAARKPRILIVDDETGIREVLTDIFVADDYDVEAVGNGKDALELIRAKPYDLVLTDIGMPGMDGETLYRVVATEHPELSRRMVFLTGDTLNPKTRSFVEGTGNRWIGKPFNVAEIEEVVGGIVRPDAVRALTDTTSNRFQRRYRPPSA